MGYETNGSELLSPKGYHTFKEEGYSMVGSKNNEYLLIDRSFNDVDTYFSNEISRSINKLQTQYPDKQIKILDLAGGTKSQAVKDITRDFGNNITAINVDLIQNIKDGNGALRVQGDATHIPLADSTIDIVYCRQFLPFLYRFKSEHLPQVEIVIREVARILKQGGVAFLDDEEELSGSKSDERRKKIEARLGVILEPHDSSNTAVTRNISKLWQKETRRKKFLVLKK